MEGMLLAAGLGTRLRPLTCTCPKAMLPVVNWPLAAYNFALLRAHGCDSITMNLCPQPSLVQNYFGDGSQWGVEMHYIVEEEPKGDAGGVKGAADFFSRTIIAINADILTDVDLNAALTFHLMQGALITLVLVQVSTPYLFGVVVTDDGGHILNFQEKPAPERAMSDWISAGIYILEPEILDLIPSNRPFEFGKDLFPIVIEQNLPFYGFRSESYWLDVGNPSNYRKAHRDILRGPFKPILEIAGRQVQPGIWVGANTDIHPSAHLEPPIVIGQRCQLEPFCKLSSTVIGDDVTVGENAQLYNSIIWSGSRIGHSVEMHDTIVANDVTLNCRNGKVDNVTVGVYCHLGEEVEVEPGLVVWPYLHVEKGHIRNSNKQ